MPVLTAPWGSAHHKARTPAAELSSRGVGKARRRSRAKGSQRRGLRGASFRQSRKSPENVRVVCDLRSVYLLGSFLKKKHILIIFIFNGRRRVHSVDSGAVPALLPGEALPWGHDHRDPQP